MRIQIVNEAENYENTSKIRIHNLDHRNVSQSTLQNCEEVSVQDLIDYENIISDLKTENEKLKEQIKEERFRRTEEHHSWEEEIRLFKQETRHSEDQIRQMKDEIRKVQKELEFTNSPGELTLDYLKNLQQEMIDRRTRIEELKKQLSLLEHDEGNVYEQLKEMNLRYQQDMKYVEFFEKVPEKKIDGLELFRSQIRRLDEELTDIFKNGLQKAYIFRGSHLLKKAEENKEDFLNILNELHNLVEDYETDGDGIENAVLTTEEYKKEAEEMLEKLEKTIRDMYSVSEKFLRIRNVIGFDF